MPEEFSYLPVNNPNVKVKVYKLSKKVDYTYKDLTITLKNKLRNQRMNILFVFMESADQLVDVNDLCLRLHISVRSLWSEIYHIKKALLGGWIIQCGIDKGTYRLTRNITFGKHTPAPLPKRIKLDDSDFDC